MSGARRQRSRSSRRERKLAEARQPQFPVWAGAVAAALVGVVYLSVASDGNFRFRNSAFPHHVLVADAWLHGQLNIRQEVLDQRSAPYYARARRNLEQRYRAQGQQLTEAEWTRIRPRLKPPALHDWAVVDGKYYGYWPPMVSALLLPYVAFAGLQASDMLFSCLIGAATVFLTFLMLREGNRTGFIPADVNTGVALAILLGLGTVHFYLAVLGQVWFLSQIVAAFFMTLAICCTLRADKGWRWALAAGGAFGAAFLSRSSVLLAGPFFLVALFAICRRQAPGAWKPAVGMMAAFSVPLVLAGLIDLGFNYVRFGNVFDNGMVSVILTGGNPMFKKDYLEHGLVDFHYLPRNLYYYFINPTLRWHQRTNAYTFDPFGNSMFLVTPALLYVFLSFRQRTLFTCGLWLGAGCCLTLLLLYFGTGWVNFGNRYLLDLMPLAILLIAIGMRGRLTRVSVGLIALSILVNSWGTYRFIVE